MSDIIKSNNELINKIKNESLTHKVEDLKNKISRLSKNQNLVLLCDVSGSMDVFVEGKTRAIDILRNCVNNFPGSQLWEFSNKAYKVTKLSEPNGYTNMAGAFAEMKINNYKEIVLLTDGAPNSPEDTLKQAVGLKINIIYIGPQPTPQFLIDLAKVTDGKFEDVELLKLGKKAEGEIENKIKGFLSA